MRMNESKSRALMLVAAMTMLGASAPAAAHAQIQPDTRAGRFEDSWFWGAKGGTMSVRTNQQQSWAPMAGVEWMITRERTALQLSLAQGFFSNVAVSVIDTTQLSGIRDVRVSDYRQASAAVLAFPGEYNGLRPYAGAGFALNVIRRAEANGMFVDMTALADLSQRVERQRSRVSPLLTLGLQGQWRSVALFGQATALPTKRDFLLNGSSSVLSFDAGIRYNVARAVERMR